MSEPKRQIYEFDQFRLDTAERQLWRREERVALRQPVALFA
jgi:hypothetical protein